MEYNFLNYNFIRRNYNNEEFNDDVCVICLDKFITNEEIFNTKCKHNFHVKCLEIWLSKNLLCPLCKCPIGSQEYLFGANSYFNMKYSLINSSEKCMICKKFLNFSDDIMIFRKGFKIHKKCYN